MQKVTKIDMASLGTGETSCTKKRHHLEFEDVFMCLCNKSYTNAKGNQD